MIDVFRAPGRSFLMPPHGVELDDDSVVDISHESLIRQWWRLGLARADRARVVALPIVIGTTLGVALGLFGAWLLSPIGPVGSVRSVLPSPGRTVPSLVWVTAAALALLLGLIAVGLTVGAVRRPAWEDAEAVGGGRLARLWRSLAA